MATKKVFFDANIFNDIFDDSRSTHSISKKAFAISIQRNIEICTSCDIATNIYYITAKYTSRENALDSLDMVKKMAYIIPFGEEELTQSIELMRGDSDYKDLEDVIQYIMALNTGCDVIVSNDGNFISKDIPCISSTKFVERFL